MSIVLQGSTSGSITLQEPAVAGSTVLDLPATSGTVLVGGTQNIPKTALPTGSVLQVVQGTYASIVSTSGTAYVDSGLSASITPTSSSSKILVLVTMNGLYNYTTASLGVKLAIFRGSTNINSFCAYTNYLTANFDLITAASGNYLDSPATTSSTTYKIQFARNGGAGSVALQVNNDISSITLLEIAA